MPHVINHLSNYVNMLQERKKTAMTNVNAETYVCAKGMVMENVARTEEKEVEVKENEWKKMPIKGMQKGNNNKKLDETVPKGKETNRFRRLQELLGDEEEETQEAIKKVQDEAEKRKDKKQQMKNVEKRKESYHMDDVKMGDIENVINEFNNFNFTSNEKVKIMLKIKKRKSNRKKCKIMR